MAAHPSETSLLAKDIEYIKRAITENYEATKEEFARLRIQINELDAKIHGDYVRRDVFEAVITPLKSIVYGLVSVVLTTVLGAILYYLLHL